MVPGIFGNCKIALIPISHLPALLLVAVHRQRRPPAPSRPFRPLIRRTLAPTCRERPPPPPASLALEPSRPSHAPRRFQSRPGGRHRDAAVDSPGQRPPHPSSERPSPTRTPGVDSTRSFALSSLPRLGTPPPHHPEPRRAHPRRGAVSPPLLRPL